MPKFKLVENCKTHEETCATLVENGLIYKNYEELGLYIVKYNKKKAKLYDENVKLCRGLVCEMNTNKIVCSPPIKSVDLVTFLDKTDGPIVYEEFLDGTMINLFYYEGEKYEGWLISTRSTIGAHCKFYSDKDFAELFNECKCDNFDYELFNRKFTYTFVLQHPENRIVVEYKQPSLTLVEITEVTDKTINRGISIQSEIINLSGLDIKTPTLYVFENVEEMYRYVDTQDYSFQGIVLKGLSSSNVEEQNGFIEYNRSKFRNPAYNYVKTLKGNSCNDLETYLSLRQSGYLKAYLSYFPEFQETFNVYMNILHEITTNTYKYYQECLVHKRIAHKDLPFIYKPLCYELHKQYNENKTPTTFAVVKKFINSQPVKRQLFLFNNIDHEQDNN